MSISAVSSVRSQYYKQPISANHSKAIQDNTVRMNFNGAMIGLSAIGVASIALVALSNKNITKTVQKKSDTFVDFMKEIKLTKLDRPNGIKNECVNENIIGTGANSIVYKFSEPSLDRWAIKIDTKHNPKISFTEPIEEVKDVFNGMNMGQEIGRIGEHVHILKRIHGKPHSIENWSSHRRAGTPITKADADAFVGDVKKIAEFPQSTFDRYAEKLKAIDEQGLKADSFNPNNILIDYKNKEMHIIDAYDYHVDAHLNTKYDLACPLVDYPNYGRYYNAMSDTQKTDYVACTKTIFEKCNKASKKVGLSTSEDTFLEFISRIDGREKNGGIYTDSYQVMKNICK